MSLPHTFSTQYPTVPLKYLDDNFGQLDTAVAGLPASSFIQGLFAAADATSAQTILAVSSYSQFLTSKYNQGAMSMRLLKNSSTKAPFVGVDSYLDAYNDNTGVNSTSSINVNFDSRGGWQPTRSGSSTVISDPFSTITAWTNISSGTGGAAIVTESGTGDPIIDGPVLDLTTGTSTLSIGGIQRNVGSIPATFGVMFISKLNAVGGNSADALTIQIGNTNTNNLQLRLFDNNFQIFQDGAWQLLSSHGGAFYTEWWVQATHNSANNYTIAVYAGTELVGTRTGDLAGSGTDGLVVIEQASGATASRESRIAIMQIGTSQLPDNMTLISVITTANSVPTKGRIVVMDEDDSLGITVNTNFIAKMSRDGGTSFSSVTLVNRGVWGSGIIDSTKSVYAYCGEVTITAQPSGSSMVYELLSTGGQYHTVNGVYMEWE